MPRNVDHWQRAMAADTRGITLTPRSDYHLVPCSTCRYTRYIWDTFITDVAMMSPQPVLSGYLPGLTRSDFGFDVAESVVGSDHSRSLPPRTSQHAPPSPLVYSRVPFHLPNHIPESLMVRPSTSRRRQPCWLTLVGLWPTVTSRLHTDTLGGGISSKRSQDQ